MPLPTERQLFDVWERGFPASASERASALLSLAQSAALMTAAAEMTLGARERALLLLRRNLLGARMTALADCPGCGERHDVEFDVDALLAHESSQTASVLHVQHDDLTLTVRPLYLADLPAAAALHDVKAAADALFERCVLEARRGEERIEPAALSPAARAAIGAALRSADPLCELTTELQCAGCGHHWSATLDTAAYLWRELHMWAERLLREIHTLASAYGWTEDDVLRLSPWRRATYAAMAAR